MTFTVFRRHNRKTCDSKNRYDPRCGCPLHVQFVWKNGDAVFEGKKLTYQPKWSLETRSWSEAQSKVKDLEKRLKDFAEGKVVPKGMTVEAVESFKTAAGIFPEYELPYLEGAEVLRKIGMERDGIALLKRALDLIPKAIGEPRVGN